MTSENVSPTPGNPDRPPPPPNITTTPGVGRGPRHCRECGAAVINYSATRCWLCEAPLSATEEDDAPGRHAVAPSLAREPRPSSEVMVFLGFLVLLLGIGLAGAVPGVLIVLLIVLTPILIRTAHTASADRAHGMAPSGTMLVGRFLSTLAVVALVGVAAIATFYVTCFAVCALGMAGNVGRGGYEGLLFLSVVSGLVTGIFVLVALIRYVRRRNARGNV
jgi:hypothetical protein